MRFVIYFMCFVGIYTRNNRANQCMVHPIVLLYQVLGRNFRNNNINKQYVLKLAFLLLEDMQRFV